MALDKQDFKEIKKIVDGSIKKSEEYLVDRMDFLIDKSKDEVITVIDKKIEESEKRINANINNKIEASEARVNANTDREVSDLSDINRAAISRTDQIDYRLRIVERKLGIKT